MNAVELARNPMATATVVHDLNADPRLPFDDGSFDAVTCCVSVDYLVRPVEVFADVARVLRPGGRVRRHVLQPLLPDEGDQGLAGQRRHGSAGDRAGVLRASGAFDEPTMAHCNPGAPGDPLYAAWGAPDVRALARLEADVVACRACPRLVAWREQVAVERRAAFRDETYWGRPVPGFGDPAARIVVLGLAPAAHGANRTGRVFTGDRSGDFLFAAMHRAGLANQPTSAHAGDGLALHGAWVTAAVKCAPPANAPTPGRARRVRPVPAARAARRSTRPSSSASARSATTRRAGYFGVRPRPRFGHGVEVAVAGGPVLLCSFHPSQQNTFTGRLTPTMLDAVFARAVALTSPPVTPGQPALANAVCTASATIACAVRQSSSRPNIEKKPWIWPPKWTCVVGHAGLGQPRRVGHAVVAQRVVLGGDDERRRGRRDAGVVLQQRRHPGVVRGAVVAGEVVVVEPAHAARRSASSPSAFSTKEWCPMRASVHGYTSAWKHTGTTGRLATHGGQVAARRVATDGERAASQPSSAACSCAHATAVRASSTAAGNGCSGASR